MKFSNRLQEEAIERVKTNLMVYDFFALNKLRNVVGKDALDCVYREYNIDNTSDYTMLRLLSRLYENKGYEICDNSDVEDIFDDYQTFFLKQSANYAKEIGIENTIQDLEDLYDIADKVENYIIH